MTKQLSRRDIPMTRDQLANTILWEIVQRWAEGQQRSCPHCLRSTQLPHTDWCLLGRWLTGGEITNDGE